MSCPECERIQESFTDSENEIYIRVGTANVQIVGCPAHAQALIITYRKGLEQLQKEENGTD